MWNKLFKKNIRKNKIKKFKKNLKKNRSLS